MLSKDEKRFRDSFGHSSTCNCIRQFKGKTIINTMRKCNCGFVKSDVDAYRQAVGRLVMAAKDVVKISDRDHVAWFAIKQAIAEVERLEVE